MPKSDPDNYPSNPRDEYRYKNVLLKDALLWCPTCGEHRPASEVGLRTMEDGTIRNQANCTKHRNE